MPTLPDCATVNVPAPTVKRFPEVRTLEMPTLPWTKTLVVILTPPNGVDAVASIVETAISGETVKA
jgi:hypothetical protein